MLKFHYFNDRNIFKLYIKGLYLLNKGIFTFSFEKRVILSIHS